MIVKRFDKVTIFMTTFFIIKNILSIIILFIFKLIVIVIIVIVAVISLIVIIIKIVIVLTTLIRELIAFRFDIIMLLIINAIFDKLLNDFVVEIKHNILLRFNNNNIF